MSFIQKTSTLAVLSALTFTASTVSAGIITYTAQTEWEALFGSNTIYAETFDDGAEEISANDSLVFDNMRITSVGYGSDNDSTYQGTTNSGYFQGEVDSSDRFDSSADGQSFTVSFDVTTNAFAITDFTMIDDPYLDIAEFGFEINGESFLLSDLLGYSDPSASGTVDDIWDLAAVEFIGFLSTEEIESFSLIHGELVRDVSGSTEEFMFDDLLFGQVAEVSEPPAYALLALGLCGLIKRRRMG